MECWRLIVRRLKVGGDFVVVGILDEGMFGKLGRVMISTILLFL